MTDSVKGNEIEPIYSQLSPSEPIELANLPVQFDYKGTTYNVTAKILMRFVPNKRIEIVLSLEDVLLGMELWAEDGGNIKISLTDRGVTFDAICASVSGSETVFLPKNSSLMLTPSSNSISRVKFHLFNFPAFIGRVILKADGWTITIAATDRTENLTKALKAQGGYVLTHVGQITREDESTFASEQLQELLECVHYFLSFALGRWAGVALPVGFDASGNNVFKQCDSRIIADGPWQASLSWFDSHHGELLSQVFPGFLVRWKSKLWQRPLQHALYWYLGACDRGVGIGVDAGLILAQNALELLAWNHCVLDRKMISAKSFQPRRLSAADKLRLLASSLDIPLELPGNLSKLRAQPGAKWEDGMDAITQIRNDLVHPAAQESYLDLVYFEAWKLSLWYIDLVLLRLCGHTGKYANRLDRRWVGEVESVPWRHS